LSRRPLLGVVSPETGEIVSCPQCEKREDILVQYEKDLRVLKAKITKLERDDETVAKTDSLWDEAECLHTWWRLSCWYPKTEFDADDFWLVKKHLKRMGLVGCLQVVCGAAYDPWISTSKNGRTKAHNGWKKLWESKSMAEDFAERVPGEEDSGKWKIWLIQRIESNLIS
jgi:hypothetical protein